MWTRVWSNDCNKHYHFSMIRIQEFTGEKYPIRQIKVHPMVGGTYKCALYYVCMCQFYEIIKHTSGTYCIVLMMPIFSIACIDKVQIWTDKVRV